MDQQRSNIIQLDEQLWVQFEQWPQLFFEAAIQNFNYIITKGKFKEQLGKSLIVLSLLCSQNVCSNLNEDTPYLFTKAMKSESTTNTQTLAVPVMTNWLSCQNNRSALV